MICQVARESVTGASRCFMGRLRLGDINILKAALSSRVGDIIGFTLGEDSEVNLF